MLSNAPQTVGRYVMVPMRSFFEALGFSVGWDESTQSVTASGRGSKKVSLQIGSIKIFVNNAVKTLDIAPMIISDVTYIPVTVISETLSCAVKWNEEAQTVDITDTASDTGYSKYPGTQVINFGERFADASLYAKGSDGSSCYYTYFASEEQYAEYIQMMTDEGWERTSVFREDNFLTEIYSKKHNQNTLNVSLTSGLATFNSTFAYTLRIVFAK